jgi:HSP20 family protein
MRDFHRMLLSTEVRELSDEVSRLFEELDGAGTGRPALTPGTCTPPLDVFENEASVEIVVDLPGVTRDALRVLIKGGVVLIVGEKARPAPSACEEATFHLVERGFGRFARAVRLTEAVDAGRASARLRGGELKIVVPKIVERRGQELAVAIDD